MIDTAISLDFAEGIDRKTLKHLRDRFLRLNQGRYQRALQAMGRRQQMVLELLPLILHGNCPTLPGYLDTACPHTIAGFEPAPELIEVGRRFNRSFRWRRQRRRAADIEAVFIMGSPGTIAHAADSDIDVWLCHRDDLSPSSQALLGAKTQAISDWAAGLGLELHIFLLSGKQLRTGRVEAQVGAENCGSAQHFLLLDEFYRSAIHLAGRYPLWWLVPADQESDYQTFADCLRERRFIEASDYLDLGSVPQIPLSEFLGAGVWQLYKGVDAPWKAVLKLLLIESYAAEGGLRPLALSLKRAVYAGQYEPEHLDPYYMLYRHLEAYLEEAKTGRLALVRQAFYLKTGVCLSRSDSAIPGWRRSQVAALVSEWRWSREYLRWLDNRHLWRVEDVQRERRGIVGELNRSYRFLSQLAREQRHASAIRPHDMALLGRKLYAAFQRKAGKVEMINPSIAPDLEEESLCFEHGGSDAAEGGGWRVYRGAGLANDGQAQVVIKHNAGLLELLLWCYCNGLLSSATRLNLQAGSTQVSLAELRALILVLEDEIPVYPLLAARKALLTASRLLTVTVFVNVGIDPLYYLTEQGMHKLSDRHDALGYSSARENLVATLDVVSLNSWGEINLSRYDSGDTLMQYLQQFLARIAAANGSRPRLSVHCHCAGRAAAIARRVETVINDVADAFFSGGAGPQSLRYVLEVGRRFFILQFAEGQPRFIACPDQSALLQKLAEPQIQASPILLDSLAMADDPAWHAVCRHIRPGMRQLMFEVVGSHARVWLSDEAGALLHWSSPFVGVISLLEPALRFLGSINERRQLRQRLFVPGVPSAACLELCFNGSDYLSKPRTVTVDPLSNDPLGIHGVGRMEHGALVFDLYCEEHEFSVREHGEGLFRAVAAYVLSRRQDKVFAPLVISDLHLPQEFDDPTERREPSSAQYFGYKVSLEQNLNQALADLQPAAAPG